MSEKQPVSKKQKKTFRKFGLDPKSKEIRSVKTFAQYCMVKKINSV